MRRRQSQPGEEDPPPPAGWSWDPEKRHEERFWDGSQWTARVWDDGSETVDPKLPFSIPVWTTPEPSSIQRGSVDSSHPRISRLPVDDHTPDVCEFCGAPWEPDATGNCPYCHRTL